MTTTADRLRSFVSYDADNGTFIWNVSRGNVSPGKRAGSKNDQGYIIIHIDGAAYRAHRLAWLFVHNKWPANQIDHINGDRSDNRIANLREATNHENCQNVRKKRNNTSGAVGVAWDKSNRKWIASIGSNGSTVYLGRFAILEDAKNAYLSAKKSLHTFQPEPRDKYDL